MIQPLKGNEPIVVTATSADNSVARVKGSEKSATITIQDNEAAIATVTTSANKVSYTEGTDSSIQIVATLDFAKSFDSSIGLTISGTATDGVDYSSNDDAYLTTKSMSGMSRVDGVTVDSNGNYYVADRDSRKIWKMTSGGTITQIGSGNCCDFSTSPSTASSTKFRDLKDMDIDSNDKIYFVDGFAVRMFDPSNERFYFIAGSTTNGVN